VSDDPDPGLVEIVARAIESECERCGVRYKVEVQRISRAAIAAIAKALAERDGKTLPIETPKRGTFW